jgi:multidrug efflux system membrane fusion protein
MSQSPTETDRPKATPRSSLAPAPAPARRNNRKALFWVLLVLALLAVCAFLIYRAHAPQAGGPGGPPGAGARGRRAAFGMMGPMPVVVVPARKSDLNIILRDLGTVTPLATITVRTQISGYLAEVKFTEGEMVNKGDVLAEIDPRPYAVALEQAQGQAIQAQAQLKEAQADLERYVTLSGQDSISKQQVDAQRALVSQYEGVVKTNQGAVDSAQLNLTYCHVTAPVSGRVGLRLVDQGNYVTPGDSSGLVLLTQVKPISVIFTLPEDDIPEVLKQVRGGSKLAVDAYNRDDTTKLASGSISTVDNTVDPTTGTFKLRAVFPNGDEALFPNQFVVARMLLNVEHDATVIPSSAIERGQDGSFVYVVGDDNKVSAKNVTLGALEGERQAVLSGISVGDKVVVDGADRLKDGMEVVPQSPTRPTGKPTGKPGAPGEHQHWKPSGSN